MNPTRKKLEKIYNQIDKIATKGKDNILEYTRYIDELIVKGDYSNFEGVLRMDEGKITQTLISYFQ